MGRLQVRDGSENPKSVKKNKYVDDYFYIDYENGDPTFFSLHLPQLFHVESEKMTESVF